MRIISIVGTRPEAIKIAPIALEARRRGIDHILIATGQHDDLFHGALDGFDVTADHDLALGRANAGGDALIEAVERTLPPLLSRLTPDIVLVQGDTNSALAAARTACYLGIPIGHVEAGLRTHDLQRPFPEEGNRVEIDVIAAHLFAPTGIARDNLLHESCPGALHLTGNTAIDALMHMMKALPPPGERHGLLVTLHRRETIGPSLRSICRGLRRIADSRSMPITLPLHPNPTVRAIVTAELGGHPLISLCEPFGYREMIRQMQRAVMILSDSGGIQEEAPALGTPLLILRDVTERTEAIQSGNAILAGTNAAGIIRLATHLLDDREALAALAVPALPFGDGTAAQKILDILESQRA